MCTRSERISIENIYKKNMENLISEDNCFEITMVRFTYTLVYKHSIFSLTSPVTKLGSSHGLGVRAFA